MSQITTDKSPQKYPILKDFMHFVSKFRQTLWIGTLKKVNKERMCSPVGFSDGLISVFQVKISQIPTDYDKIPQLFQVSKFLCIFFKFLTDFVDWKFGKGQQGKKVLSSGLFRSVFSVFKWNCLKLTPKMTKVSKFSKSQRFYAFFSNFWQTLWIGTLEKVNKENN